MPDSPSRVQLPPLADDLQDIPVPFSGHVQIELVQQHNDVPSIFHTEGVQRSYGFHHWARLTGSIDVELASLTSLGYEEVYSDVFPSGTRVVFVDTKGALPGMIELVEATDAQERAFAAMSAAARDWDGSDPVRRGQ